MDALPDRKQEGEEIADAGVDGSGGGAGGGGGRGGALLFFPSFSSAAASPLPSLPSSSLHSIDDVAAANQGGLQTQRASSLPFPCSGLPSLVDSSGNLVPPGGGGGPAAPSAQGGVAGMEEVGVMLQLSPADPTVVIVQVSKALPILLILVPLRYF